MLAGRRRVLEVGCADAWAPDRGAGRE